MKRLVGLIVAIGFIVVIVIFYMNVFPGMMKFILNRIADSIVKMN